MRERLIRDLSRDPGILILAYPYARTWRDVSFDTVQQSWSRIARDEPAALYVHIPFCHRKCTFCDFLAYYGRPQAEIEQYLALLREEIRLVAGVAKQVDIRTVHLGGGTPSLLSPVQVETLLDGISSNLNLSPQAQITMEVFPDLAISKQLLNGWKQAGVNRLSLGIQFFDDDLKRTLNRTDSAEDNLRLANEAAEIDFDDINLDLMCGLPEQSQQSWKHTLMQTLRLSPSHVCVFPVSVRHSGIALFKQQASLPEVTKTRLMYDEAVQTLSNAGYHRTTRHNFVRNGFEYRYERMIAELTPLIGLGANSISYSQDCIYRNHSDLRQYASSISSSELPVHSGHYFGTEERPHNYAVRRIEYLHLSGKDFENRFGQSLQSVFGSEIELLEEMGLARLQGGDLILSEDGVYFTSAVKRTLFHKSAWESFERMKPEDFTIERGTFTTASVRSSVK